jgi:DNA-directed RNA polymerase subunit K/omega
MNKDNIMKDEYPKILTVYEKAVIIGVRGDQLANGSKPRVTFEGQFIPNKIAEKELSEKKLTEFVVERKYPDHNELIKVNDLKIFK